jgi:hypothetical protein
VTAFACIARFLHCVFVTVCAGTGSTVRATATAFCLTIQTWVTKLLQHTQAHRPSLPQY